jgi:hypothetical protein
MPTYEISILDHDLPPDAHRVDLTGSPRRLKWPGICPNCGGPASERIPISKIFRPVAGVEAGSGPDFVTRIDVPFCTACAERQRHLAQPPGVFDGWLAVFTSPLVISFGFATAFAVIAFRVWAGMSADEVWAKLAGLALVAFFVLVAAWSVVAAWRSARFFRVPRQTEITRAFDFSDNLGNLVAGQRRAYAIRNAAFAEAFATANHDHLVTDEVRTRAERRNTVAVVLLLAGVFVAWWLFVK